MPSRRGISTWLFLVPALVFYLAFFALPIVQSFAVSLFQWPTASAAPDRFVALDNYARLIGDHVFWWALVHNLVLVALSLVIQLPIALFLASLLSGRVVARAFFRTVFFAPMILPSIVIARVWMQIYFPELSQGLLAGIGKALGIPGAEGGLLANPHTALLAIIVTISWRYTGFHMVLFMAGIETIPEEQFEAARVDGAGPWQTFRHVTLPSLAPVIRISAVLSIVGSLKYFDLFYIMTGRGAVGGSTEIMTTYMYKVGIDDGNGGYGSALAVATFLVSLAIVGALFAVRRRLARPRRENSGRRSAGEAAA